MITNRNFKEKLWHLPVGDMHGIGKRLFQNYSKWEFILLVIWQNMKTMKNKNYFSKEYIYCLSKS